MDDNPDCNRCKHSKNVHRLRGDNRMQCTMLPGTTNEQCGCKEFVDNKKINLQVQTDLSK